MPAFRTFLQRFGSLDRLLVVFTAPEGKTSADYNEEISGWVSALRAAPEIESVDSGVAGPDRDWAWLGEHALLLMHGPALDAALARLRPEGMATALAASRQLLSVPSPAVEQLVRQDPLDFFGLLREQLGGARAGFSVGLTEAGYVSPDGRHRLVVAKPRQPPYDTRFSHALRERLDRIRSERLEHRNGSLTASQPRLAVTFAGGHLIALDTEALVKRESIWNSVGSLLLILPLLYIVFRSVWLLSCGALPSLISLAIVLGLHGARPRHPLGGRDRSRGHALRARRRRRCPHVRRVWRGGRARADRKGCGRLTRAAPSASMFLGMLTTAATFYGLVFVDFPAVRQLGLLIGHSMVACGVLTLVLVPALLPHRPTTRSRFSTLEWPWLADWIRKRRVVLLGHGDRRHDSCSASPRRGCSVNASLDRLKSTTPAAQAEEQVEQMFGLPSDIYVVLQEGPDLEPLLQENEALHRAAAATGARPSPSTAARRSCRHEHAQAATRARLRAEAPPTAVILASLTTASAAAGGFAPARSIRSSSGCPGCSRTGQELTFDDFQRHGLADLLERFVVHDAKRMDAGELRLSFRRTPKRTSSGRRRRRLRV